MRLIEFIKRKKFQMLIVSLFAYIVFSFFEGERGFISYIEHKNLKGELITEKNDLNNKIKGVERKINLLTKNLDLDYLEILYRQKFMLGKKNEDVYVLK